MKSKMEKNKRQEHIPENEFLDWALDHQLIVFVSLAIIGFTLGIIF